MALSMKPATKPTPKVPEPVTPTKPAKAEKIDDGGHSLNDILAGIRKSKGEKMVVRGNQLHVPRRLPTGIFEFDFYIGGGFPRGRYSIVYGPESSCKTNIALKAAATAQKLPGPCNKVIWVNVEQSFDPVWAEKMGVNVEDLLVVEPGYGEEAVDLVDALVRADDVALIVVDSMAALIANKEVGQSTEVHDMGTSAFLIKRMVNKLMVAFSECKKRGNDPCVILINQTRFKLGVMFGDPETMPGGEAQKFLSSLRVRFYGKNEVDKATSTILFKDVKAVIKKSKVPVRAVDFTFKMAMSPMENIAIGDTESFGMVKSHLQALNLLEKTGQGYKLKFADHASQMFPTITSIQDRYYKDEEFRRRVQQVVLDNYVEEMVLVDEPEGPVQVEPGKVQPIAEGQK